jgi:hypothetical protein
MERLVEKKIHKFIIEMIFFCLAFCFQFLRFGFFFILDIYEFWALNIRIRPEGLCMERKFKI